MEKETSHRTEKPWGFELLFAETDVYIGKILFIKQGHRLSLHYHKKKDETLYIHQGQASMEIETFGEMSRMLANPGYSVRILPGIKHRIAAMEDTFIFEVSTPQLEDVVRVEDDYGRTDS